MTSRNWHTRFGFYFLAVGSAFGLGNLWRFPYVVGENGGGAFVLLYIFLALTLGMPLLIGELMLGRFTRQSVMMAAKKISVNSGKKFKLLSAMPVVMSLVVLSYYSVISGWVLHFILQFSLSLFGSSQIGSGSMMSLLKNGGLQFGLASVHLLITLIVVVKGIQDGLEKWIGWMMPFFAFLVVILIWRSTSLSTTTEVMRFLFYPDFSKLTLSSLNHAIGHVFFTLSVGFGTMVTFGSYIRDDQHLPTVGLRVAFFDTIVSFGGLFIVFPLVFKASNQVITDPALMFDVLPQFFNEMNGGLLFGLAFFVCLYMAALNASIGLLETIVSNIVDTFKGMSRSRAGWMSGLTALFLTLLPALSGSFFSETRLGQKGLIELIDSLLINGFLPLVALGLSFIFFKGLSLKEKERLFIDKEKFVSYSMFPQWIFAVQWFAPVVIILGWILHLFGLLTGHV
ncbi:MAG: sodium-dependent transporter [Bdellovibrionota bacterium]